jgi:hypothetical protein
LTIGYCFAAGFSYQSIQIKDKQMAESKNTVDTVDNEAVEEAAASSGVTDVAEIIKSLNTPNVSLYSSIKADSFESRLAIASAMTTSLPLDENLGKTIDLTNFIVQPVDLVNQETGETNTAPRIVLIDKDNVAYHATSIGILSSLRNMISVLGEPASWPAPVSVQIVKQKGRNGYSFFTVKFV